MKKNKITKKPIPKSSEPSIDSNYDPRTRFLAFVDKFRIDSHNIPRPLRSQRWNQNNISDSFCVLEAFRLLGVPHDSFINNIKESKGWLIGPHSYKYDWTLTFGTATLEQELAINPWLLITDSPIQLAIAILRSKCIYGTPRESKMGKEALKHLKLELLIPEEATRKRSEDINLRYYKNHPIYLKYAVSLYEFVISKYWKKEGYKRKELSQKEEDIGKAFELIFGIPMPKKITTGERNKTKINTALSFLSYEVSTDEVSTDEVSTGYSGLHTIFYGTLNKEIKDIKLYEFPEDIDSIVDFQKIDKNLLKEYKSKLRNTSLHTSDPLLY